MTRDSESDLTRLNAVCQAHNDLPEFTNRRTCKDAKPTRFPPPARYALAAELNAL